MAAALFNLVDDIFHADDFFPLEDGLNHGVIQPLSAATNFPVPTLGDQLPDGCGIGEAPSDPRGGNAEHVHCRFVQTDEDTIEDLAQTKELQNLLGLGGHVVNTANTDNKGNFWFGFHEIIAKGIGNGLLVGELLVLLAHDLLIFVITTDDLNVFPF